VNPTYTHTSEDPSVFQDKRGNFHMLVNALPGGCNPKLQQGGHAWSKDGIIWSEPRVVSAMALCLPAIVTLRV